MRLGIISDIHANYEALVAVYKALEASGCEEYYCLGDVVGYGPSPKECIQFVREHNIKCVIGNHDKYVSEDCDSWPIKDYAQKAILWTRSVLSEDELEWLRALPVKIDAHGITFIHASLDDDETSLAWPYILDTNAAARHFFFQTEKICFFGHIHIPLVFTLGHDHSVGLELLRSCTLDKDSRIKYLLNVGSVGQPRDSDRRASSVMYDTETFDLRLLRVEYDIAETQKKILDADLPELLATRLSSGK